ncbi:unnamed protein product [Cladocopium goreaui]|uniref:EF-hand domain-containing protein n=1 Tax=Cladocopium goreaui TaxID=2562237 RepID=A0A9P1DHZ8_9DINO|nr:unnamed protein product [Cladocopium goreaui]
MFGALKPRNLWRRWWDSTPKHHRFPDFPGRIPKSEVCWAAFQVFDKDCNGTVSFEELEQVLNSASMEGTFAPELRRELWEELTQKATVEVDFDHFLAALRGVKASNVAAESRTLPKVVWGSLGDWGGRNILT